MTLNDLASGKPLQGDLQVLVYVLGGSCSGKSTFLSYCKQHYQSEAGFVEVGAYFRAKYPPDFFQGQASPQHTREEAISAYRQLMQEQVADVRHSFVFVDGQPRSADQVKVVLESFTEYPKLFLLFDASQKVRIHRAGVRYPNRFDDPKQQDDYFLAHRRITETDYRSNYETMVALLEANQRIQIIHTDSDGFIPGVIQYLQETRVALEDAATLIHFGAHHV